MEIIRCIVLEDEEPSQNLLRHYFNQLPDYELVGVFDNPLLASEYLEENTVDLIITDVEMPQRTGLDFIRTLTNKPPVIIISASIDYAYESIQLDVIAYLRKPVSLEELQKALEKAKPHILNKKSEVQSMFVKVDGRVTKIVFEEVIYIEAMGDYIKIVLKDNTIATLYTMNKIMESLPSKDFMRVHKSYIISTDKIKSIDSTNSLVIMNNKIEIPLGRAFKPDFVAKFKAIN